MLVVVFDLWVGGRVFEHKRISLFTTVKTLKLSIVLVKTCSTVVCLALEASRGCTEKLCYFLMAFPFPPSSPLLLPKRWVSNQLVVSFAASTGTSPSAKNSRVSTSSEYKVGKTSFLKPQLSCKTRWNDDWPYHSNLVTITQFDICPLKKNSILGCKPTLLYYRFTALDWMILPWAGKNSST